MKKIILLITIISGFGFATSFVSPINFSGSQAEKDRVVDYIKKDVKRTYSQIGMDDPMTLRMMEKENLDAFKELLSVKNTSLLQRVITQYCNIGMCNYTTIKMMYYEQNKASTKKLTW